MSQHIIMIYGRAVVGTWSAGRSAFDVCPGMFTQWIRRILGAAMGYVDEYLDSDEQVIHRGTLHPIIYVGPVLIALPGILLFLAAMSAKSGAIFLLSLFFVIPLALTVLVVKTPSLR